MNRSSFILLLVMWLVLNVAVMVLWVRSHWVHDIVRIGVGKDASMAVGSNSGCIEIQAGPYRGELPQEGHWMLEHLSPSHAADSRTGYEVAGGAFGFYVCLRARGPVTNSFVAMPDWFLVLAMLLVSGVVIRRVFLRRRAERDSRRGICPVCGYDMRASSDRCPECGEPAATKRAANAGRGSLGQIERR